VSFRRRNSLYPDHFTGSRFEILIDFDRKFCLISSTGAFINLRTISKKNNLYRNMTKKCDTVISEVPVIACRLWVPSILGGRIFILLNMSSSGSEMIFFSNPDTALSFISDPDPDREWIARFQIDLIRL
jgi:hypothetical protein